MTYSINYSTRKMLRECFARWKLNVHAIIKDKTRKEYKFKEENAKVTICNEYDPKILETRSNIEALKLKLAEIIKNKQQLGSQYDDALKRGMILLNKETVPISSAKSNAK